MAGERGVALDIEADAPLGTCVVHSPGAGADFVCVEPVSHAVDAHQLDPALPKARLRLLEPGQAGSFGCRFVAEVEHPVSRAGAGSTD